MPTRDELYTALRNADAAGDAEGARKLAAYIQALPADAAPERPGPLKFKTAAPNSPDSMLGRLGAGAALGVADIGRTVLNAASHLPLPEAAQQFIRTKNADFDAITEANKDSTAFSLGRVGGNIAVTLPVGGALAQGLSKVPIVASRAAPLVNSIASSGFVTGMPAATTVGGKLAQMGIRSAGGAITGGASAALVDPEHVARGAAISAALPPGLAGAGKLASYGGNALMSLIQPFTEAGRAAIVGRTLNRFADDPSKIAAASGGPSVTGALPTVAEATSDAGIARLQDALRSVDPQIENMIGGRLAANNAARVNTLQSLAGDSASRGAAVAAREAATAPLYQAATSQQVAISPELAALLQRPSAQKALARAQNIAGEQGRTFDLGTDNVTGQTLQDLKMGMDALLKDPTSGIAGAEASAVKATRDAIVAEMERAIPEFQAARSGYASLSKPLNAMDIGEHIARKATSNLSDLSGNPRMQANALLGLLRDEPRLIEQATGRKGLGGSLDNILDPDQMAKLRAVADEADRTAAVAAAGNGPGSASAQRLASQNILQSLLGRSLADSAFAGTALGKPLNLLYGGVADPKIQKLLADAVLDPNTAALLARQQATSGRSALERFLENPFFAQPVLRAAPASSHDR